MSLYCRFFLGSALQTRQHDFIGAGHCFRFSHILVSHDHPEPPHLIAIPRSLGPFMLHFQVKFQNCVSSLLQGKADPVLSTKPNWDFISSVIEVSILCDAAERLSCS